MDKKQWKRSLPVVALVLVMLAGICIVLYPVVSNMLYENNRSAISTEYKEQVEGIGQEEVSKLLGEAEAYNRSLLQANVILADPFDPKSLEQQGSIPYMSILNYAEDGIMGYLSIPVIDVELPIYHGTTSSVLEKGIGHLEQTSFPIGGESTHSVLTGHTGLAGKRMLTDLTELEEGDVFYIRMIDEILAYKVVNKAITKPKETELLSIVPGEDRVTLVTCYPYGVNSHRLLVTGERTSYKDAMIQEEQQDREVNSVWKEEYKKAILLCLAVYIPVIGIGIFLTRRRRSSRESDEDMN